MQYAYNLQCVAGRRTTEIDVIALQSVIAWHCGVNMKVVTMPYCGVNMYYRVVTMPYSDEMALALAKDFLDLVVNVDIENESLISEVSDFIKEFKQFNAIQR